jgi:hypothetical protein
MYLRGEPQWKIAKKESVDTATVSRDLKAIREEWKQHRIEYCQDGVERELSKIDRLELEYWNGWVRSCEAAKRETEKIIDGGGDSKARSEISTTKEFQAGDPRFLEGVRWCIDRRLILFGKDKPKKTAFTDSDGNDLTPSERGQRLGDLFASVRRLSNGNGMAHSAESGGPGGNGKRGPMEDGSTPSDN